MDLLIVLAAIGGAIWYFFFRDPKSNQQKWVESLPERGRLRLGDMGTTPDERERFMVNAFVGRRGNTLGYTEDYFYPDTYLRGSSNHWSMNFAVDRAVDAMQPRERLALLIAFALANRELIKPEQLDWAAFAVIWANGAGRIAEFESTKGTPFRSAADAVNWYTQFREARLESAISLALSWVNNVDQNHPTVRMLQGYVRGGNAWTQHEELKGKPFRLYKDYAQIDEGIQLYLGALSPQPFPATTYTGERSLVTIAPPGSGKTQCQVLPNLVQWRGAALVLDVKGDLHPATKDWRAKNVGPVYRFAPLDPANSHCFNPLTYVRGDRMNVWEDSRYLAELFIVQKPGARDPFWDDRSRDLFTGIIASVCYNVPPEQRSMNTVLGIISRIGWDEFVAGLIATTDVASMMEEGHSLKQLQEKTLDGVLQNLKTALQAWAGERVRETTKRSDWNPLDLRGPGKPTIYFSLKSGEIDAFASVLRVFVGMHIRALTADLPPKPAPPILFMLDELPRLRYMAPVEEALELGRDYGIRLWMFAQNLGQLEQAYPNARAMVGSCAAAMFMNPSLQDGTAQFLSEQLGYQESLLDGQRRKLVEPTDLAGPDYDDKIICIASGLKPMLIAKIFAHRVNSMHGRMARS